jgi:hypothetical protein
MLPGMSGEATVADRTWSPEVVEKVARSIESVCSDGNSDARRVAADMLSASPLPDALDLIERLTNCANDFLAAVAGESPGLLEGNCDIEHLNAGLADAAAFVARVREG